MHLISTAIIACFEVLYSVLNDPSPKMIPNPENNDPQIDPEMIPISLHIAPEMIPN